MNFFELVFVSFYLLVGVLGGWIGYSLFGWLGVVVFLPVGVFGSMGFLKLLSFVRIGVHERPSCRNGVCDSKSYRWASGLDGYPISECNCGLSYVMKGRRFLEVDAGERRFRPYMRKSLFGRWRLDPERTNDWTTWV